MPPKAAVKCQNPQAFNRAQALYVKIRQLHEEAVQLLQGINDVTNPYTGTTDQLVDCTDAAFAIRECKEFIATLETELNGVYKMLCKMVCTTVILDPNNPDARVEGEYAIGVADIGKEYAIPTFDKNPEAYTTLMNWLGIDPQLHDRGKELTEEGEHSTEVVKLHWPGLQYYVKRLMAAGYNPPDGLNPDAAWPVYKLGLRKRKALA